ncbi:MAG TPA: NAD-dependent epimerase/dehydratase family protein [Paludibacter sp.]|nr:NAD-dependent epimerase/dehydratase family protein [Prolixibacteraceae bacterium]
MKGIYNIGITCIGSGIGQSIINSLRLSRLPIKTFGLGTNPFAYGSYDCDVSDYTLGIYEKGYIDNLISKCHEHKIDLIIPGHDDDALICSQNSDRLMDEGIKTIVSSEKLISICRDKERMSNELNKISDVFVKCYDKNTIGIDIENNKVKFPFIAKPRSGFGSKGIEIIRSIDDLRKITEDHILQELAIPAEDDTNYIFYMSQISQKINPQVSEISIQLIHNQDGISMGRMLSYNKLHNGVPIEIVPYENEYIWRIIDLLTPTFIQLGLKGPLNIQGRLTEQGLKLFEMNPRFTGITGLRALMGFNEVEACVKEWLGIDKGTNQLRFNYNRFGIRQTEDKSIPIERNNKVKILSEKLNQKINKKKKTILITGACGYLGQNLINQLIEEDEYELWLFDLEKGRMLDTFNGKIENIFDKRDLEYGKIQLGNVDILLHLGFARPHHSNEEIADSLNFTIQLFTRANAHQIPAIINISSQSVYSTETRQLRTENTPVAPSIPYAQAKYATELFLSSLKTINNQLHFSSLRLAALSGGANGLVAEADFLNKFVRNAIEGKRIKVIGGTQQIERLDIRDAVKAIIKMLKSNSLDWKPVYNLGSGQITSLIEIAHKVSQIAMEYNGGILSEIEIEDIETNLNFGMNSLLFYNDMQWQPENDLNNTIVSLSQYYLKGIKS